METEVKKDITVGTNINAPVEKVWDLWTNPFHILHWSNASDDWYTPYAENNVVPGGRFLSRMESRNGKEGFDFTGTYSDVEKYHLITYMTDDERRVDVEFRNEGNSTKVTERFEIEHINPPEMQREGWQAMLDNFKRYVESYGSKVVLHYEVFINSNPDKVYHTLTEKETHKEWTSVFNPTSHYEGSWNKGSRISFLGEDPSGSGEGGMVCYIRENIPSKYISAEYVAVIKDGKEITSGKDAVWVGMMENYTLKEVNGKTILSVDIDSTQEFRDYFSKTYPKALEKLKEIAERN